MATIVQKFGGSSMGSLEKIAHVARRVADRAKDGTKLLVVVSAMQGETDRLLALAHGVAKLPDPRETDQLLATGEQVSAALLAMTLKTLDVRACSMTGSQMGLLTDGAFSKARIKGLAHDRLHQVLAENDVVVATGFQGIDAHGNLTTLGRGGSDTSAVALAAGVDADECEIYTDVIGVFTADPRICPDAIKLDEITFDEMMEMASQGSKVLQIRSVELAMNHNIPLRVRSTFSDDPGTLVHGDADDGVLEKLVVRGISHNAKEIKVTLRSVPDRPGTAATAFTALAAEQINVDVIVQNTGRDGSTDLSFTCDEADTQRASDILREVVKEVGAESFEVDDSIAKVSIVGVGMRSHAGVAAAMFEALKKAEVNIQMITTSEIKVTCVIKRKDTEKAVQTLHDRFQLASGGIAAKPGSKGMSE